EGTRGHARPGCLAGAEKADEAPPQGRGSGPGAGRPPPPRCANETGRNAKERHCDVPWRYTGATRRAEKPTAQRGRQYLKRKIRQFTSPIIEQRPIRLLPGASFRLPAPRLLLATGPLFSSLYGGKVRKVRKVRICCAVAARGVAVRQVRVRLLLAGLDPTLDGFHRGAVTVLT